MSEPFASRLKDTVQAGILHGVYAALVVAFIGLALLWLAGDYSSTRAAAQNGQRAFEAIVRANQQQTKAQEKPAQ